MESAKSASSTIAAQWLAADRSLDSKKNCIAYSLFCIFSSSSNSSSSISFFVLLNCLYLNPRVLPFVHSPPYPTGAQGMEWVSSCLVLSCWLPA